MLRVYIALAAFFCGIIPGSGDELFATDVAEELVLEGKSILEVKVVVPALPEDGSRPQAPQTLPFGVGEKMVFSVTWSGIHAGEATLEVKELLSYQGHEVFRIVSTAKTNKFFSVFYKLRDTLESLFDVQGLFSRRYRKVEYNGNQVSNREIIFDQEQNMVLYKGKRYYTLPGVQDELSLFYYVRTLDFQVGNSIYMDVFSSKKNWRVKANVLRKERITVPAGTFNTIVVEPEIKFDGILKTGNMTLWFTDDERKIPVKMKSNITIGSIEANLEKLQLAGTPGEVSDKGDKEEEE